MNVPHPPARARLRRQTSAQPEPQAPPGRPLFQLPAPAPAMPEEAAGGTEVKEDEDDPLRPGI